jgi:hypothetical protein
MSRTVPLFQLRRFSPTAAFCLLVFGTPLLGNKIVFSNLVGPGFFGYGVDGSAFFPESLAVAFIPTAPNQLAGARVVVSQQPGLGNDPFFNMSLFSDTGGFPGSLIEQFGTGLTAPVLPGGIVSATSLLNPMLLIGTPYWLF